MPTVLLVDDEPRIVALLAQFLAGTSCTVLEAFDGDTALTTLADVPVDVVVADMRMPRPDCWDILEELQRDKRPTQVVVITGCGTTVLHREAESRGACAVLEKPFDAATLVRAVNDAVGRAQEARRQATVT